MTEQPSSLPQAAPAAGKDAPKQPDPQERVDRLRAQLAEAEADLPPEPGTVRLRVVKPHDSFTRGAVTVTRDLTPVPAGSVPQLMAAAADAGVTIEEA